MVNEFRTQGSKVVSVCRHATLLKTYVGQFLTFMFYTESWGRGMFRYSVRSVEKGHWRNKTIKSP